MPRINKNNILSRLHIESYFKSRLEKFRPGRNSQAQALCPFHEDTKPSFSVNTKSGFWHCHGCGAKGNVFDFEMKKSKVPFREALQNLAIEAGISITEKGPTRGKPEAVYDYKNNKGKLAYQVVRFPGKIFKLRQPGIGQKWEWNLRGVERVPYRLPELLKADPSLPVLVPEGEKDVDTLRSHGFISSTNSEGAEKFFARHAKWFIGRHVVLLLDDDEAGQKHGLKSGKALIAARADSVRIVDFNKVNGVKDVTEFLNTSCSVEDLHRLIDNAPHFQEWAKISGLDEKTKTREAKVGGGSTTGNNASRGGSRADRLVKLALEKGIDLFHDQFDEGMARIPVGTHREAWRIKSKRMKAWLGRSIWESEGRALNSEDLSAASNVLHGIACLEGKRHHLHNRVAICGEDIWYDLADEHWRAVRITSSGWQIIENPPILFRRYSHQLPQVEPQSTGDLRELLPFLNLQDPQAQLLLLVYLSTCLIPQIPHPILVTHGVQGSAKTSMTRMIRRLVDPSCIEVLSFPTNGTELIQQIDHNWIAPYDNTSHLADWASNALCRAVTGDGFSKRRNYSDEDDVLFHFQRCVVLNGINIVARKPDLLDRCLLMALEPIALGNRKTEADIWTAFEVMRPRIFGAMLSALSRAVAIHPKIKIERLPRMADFALWGCAIAEGLGVKSNSFLAAYESNARNRNDEVLHANPVASAIAEFMRCKDEWKGSASDLLTALDQVATQLRLDTRSRDWPKAAQVLSRRLNEITPNLTADGIQIMNPPNARPRVIEIRRITENTVGSVVSDDVTGFIANCPSEPSLEASEAPSESGRFGTGNKRKSDASDASDEVSSVRSPPEKPAQSGSKDDAEK